MAAIARLSGERALVTGASSGLGAHFAELLASHGAEVILAARRIDALDAVAHKGQVHGQPTTVALEVDDRASRAKLVKPWVPSTS